eukprot:SAG22_NODE_218_length_14885_cov_24.733699_6_plen_218_part_00
MIWRFGGPPPLNLPNGPGEGSQILYLRRPYSIFGVFGAQLREHDLVTLIDRMKALLRSEFGISGATVANANARGHDMQVAPGTPGWDDAAASDRELERQFKAREYAVRGAAALHWDNAKKHDWLYTALLYVGSEDVRHGHTVFVDDVSGGTAVDTGLLVAHKPGRLVVFSSGGENVHTGLTNTAGYRCLFQVWFKCQPDGRGDFQLPAPATNVRSDL